MRSAAFGVRRGIAATCAGLLLTPRVRLIARKSAKRWQQITIVCSLDCAYAVRLDGRKTLTGRAVGKVGKVVRFVGALAKGHHVFEASATATLNAGPPGTAALTFRL